MSTFRFNFLGEGDDDAVAVSETKDEIQWLECEEHIPNKIIKKFEENVTSTKIFTCGDIKIKHINVINVIDNIEEDKFKNEVILAEKYHSDLVAGKYEGGLKIWECTNDLMQYLVENLDNINLNKLSVLDLGCGAGLLGIYAIMKGSLVTFQDYNKEVIEYFTIPNVLLNIGEEERKSKIEQCKFYSGDWDSFNKKLPNTQLYDVIVTSEVIYNESNYTKLINLFAQRLKKDGVAYIAAKTYYFGVGGSTRQFEQRIQNNGILKCEVCWFSVGGIQREILKITHKINAT